MGLFRLARAWWRYPDKYDAPRPGWRVMRRVLYVCYVQTPRFKVLWPVVCWLKDSPRARRLGVWRWRLIARLWDWL